MKKRRRENENLWVEADPWPHEPPPDLLEALDRAAWRLSELDARGVRISLGVSDGNPRASVSAEGFSSELSSLSLLELVCGSKLEETLTASP